MRFNQVLLVTLLAFLTLTSCEKLEVPDDTPKSIIKKIRDEKDNGCLESVYVYDYEGRPVYFFSYPCPEGCYALIDEDCNRVKDTNGNDICSCSIGGAFCADVFWNNKTGERLIWQKN